MWTREQALRFMEATGRLVALVVERSEQIGVEQLDAAWEEWAQQVEQLKLAVQVVRARLVERARRDQKVILFPKGGRREVDR